MSEQTQEQPQQERQEPTSFRDRTLDRLGTESRPDREETIIQEPSNLRREHEQEDVTDVQEEQGGADQLDLNDEQESMQRQEQPGDTDQPEDELGEGVETYVEGDDEPTELLVLRQRAEEAESKTLLMQQDYTKKTQELGDSRRELTESLDHNARIAKIYVERASGALKRYENVNWQQLQTQLPPDKYQAEVAKYRQVVAMRDRAVGEHETISKFANEQMEQRKSAESEHSKDVLRHAIPNWGGELYGTLREYASQWDFTAEEVDQMTDHRLIRLLHNSWKMTQTGKKVQNIQQHGTQARNPGGPNKPQARGRDGRYRKAEAEHHARPGDRNSSRNFFLEKLKRERTRTGYR